MSYAGWHHQSSGSTTSCTTNRATGDPRSPTTGGATMHDWWYDHVRPICNRLRFGISGSTTVSPERTIYGSYDWLRFGQGATDRQYRLRSPVDLLTVIPVWLGFSENTTVTIEPRHIYTGIGMAKQSACTHGNGVIPLSHNSKGCVQITMVTNCSGERSVSILPRGIHIPKSGTAPQGYSRVLTRCSALRERDWMSVRF